MFGSVADAYDAHRPGYPDELFALLLDRAPADPVALDIGCGTGRVAVALADRGVVGTGIEPDPDMAAVAARRLHGTGWNVQISDFETYEAPPRSVDLITCGQAWHWIDPDLGLDAARALLRPGGVLALFWNRGEWDRCPPDLRGELDTIYERLAPDMQSSIAGPGKEPKGRPLSSDPPPPGFAEARVDEFHHVVTYTDESWVDLLRTHSNHVLLPDALRNRIHDEVAAAIRSHGGSFELVYRCECWSAQRAGDP